jgi:hypothetical protein
MDRLAFGDVDVVGLHAVLDRTGVRMQHLVEEPAVSPGREDLEQRVEGTAHVGGDALRDRRPASQPGRGLPGYIMRAGELPVDEQGGAMAIGLRVGRETLGQCRGRGSGVRPELRANDRPGVMPWRLRCEVCYMPRGDSGTV